MSHPLVLPSANSGASGPLNQWLFAGVQYAPRDMPILRGTSALPNELGLFSEAVSAYNKNFDFWPCFYEKDSEFERIWNFPRRYLKLLERFPGIIGPDFSMYRSMPEAMQMWNCLRSRIYMYNYERSGGSCIPNVRWGSVESFSYCFNGLPFNSTLAVGTVGCLEDLGDVYWFCRRLDELISRIPFHTLVVYGPTPDKVFSSVEDAGIRIIPFKSKTRRALEGDLRISCGPDDDWHHR